jgi:glycine betaine catabolism B
MATEPRIWDRESDDELVCLDVHAETHDVKSFTFAAPDGQSFQFVAGQYFMFETQVGGEPHSRCYSISSSPHRQGAFTVTVKRVPGGAVSNWFHDHLAAGARIKASGPLGVFARPADAGAKLLLMSGGSGVTPVMSMLRDLADIGTPVDVVFLHAGRTPADFIFADDLAMLAKRMKGLRLLLLPETVGDAKAWPGLTGRISRAFMELAVPDIAGRHVLCCGPAPFMAAARSISAELGVPAERYVEESFDAAVIEEAPATIEPAAQVFTVEFAKQKRTIELPPDQTVLAAAKKAGVRLPSSCANGLCGTCKSKLVSGAVDMKHSGGIRQREIDAGFFLPCCSKPLSDLVVER